MRASSGGPIAAATRGLLCWPMANKNHAEPEPTKKNEAPKDPQLQERVERLSEKVSSVSDTLSQIEETLERNP